MTSDKRVYLYLVRHAKSSWADPGMADMARPLNGRGKHDAPVMGRRLKARGVVPDLIITSPAKRARRTTKEIAKAMGYEGDVDIADSIYGGGAGEIIRVAQSVDASVASLIVVGHNPDMTELANSLADFHIDNVPTCAIFCARFDAWESVGLDAGQFEFFDYPKLGD